MEEDTYIVQVFSSFAPAEANPLILRLHSSDCVRDLIDKCLVRFAELKVVVVAPSPSAEDYAVSPANGDGSVVTGTWPFRLDTVVRQCGLEFPYMLALHFVGDHSQSGPGSDTAHHPNRSGRDIVAAEKAALAAHKEKVAELRRQRVLEIERQQAEREKKHFQHCESYEVYRREAMSLQAQQREEARKKAETLGDAKALRQAVEEEKANEEQESLLETHRKLMESKLREQQERQAAMAQQRAEAQRQERERKEAAALALKAQREAERELRLRQLSESILEELQRDLDREQKADEDRIAAQRRQRQAQERAILEMQRVEHLEHTKNVIRESERTKRCEHQLAIDRTTAELQQSVADAEDRTQKEEAARFAEWKAQRSKLMESMESQLELEYRSRIH